MNQVGAPERLLELVRLISAPNHLQHALETGLSCAATLACARVGSIQVLLNQGQLQLAAYLPRDEEYGESPREINCWPDSVQSVVGVDSPCIIHASELPAVLRVTNDTPSTDWFLLLPLGENSDFFGLLCLQYPEKPQLSPVTLGDLRLLGAILSTGISISIRISQLERESRTDPLTGLGNRRHFEDAFRRELSRARRSGGNLSLAMVDVDRMKIINDRWGHLTGDRVLKKVSQLLENVRTTDVVARYGGDEFIIIMPDTSLDQANSVIDRLRAGLDQVNESGAFPFRLQMSIGVRQMVDPDRDLDLLGHADAEMYEEKRQKQLPSDVVLREINKLIAPGRA